MRDIYIHTYFFYAVTPARARTYTLYISAARPLLCAALRRAVEVIGFAKFTRYLYVYPRREKAYVT